MQVTARVARVVAVVATVVVLLLAVPWISHLRAQHAATLPSTVVGDLRFHTLRSQVFGNSRTLRVLVPDGYDAPEHRNRRYPVLYLNDGQTLFDVATSRSHMEWRVDETVRALVQMGRIPPMIVVGIDNAGSQRGNEYIPYVTPLTREARGARYPDFLVNDVMPFINSHYRTLHDPSHTGLGGASFGAFSSLYAVAMRPGVFGLLLLESPTLHVAGGAIFTDIAHVTQWPERVSIGIGTNEARRRQCPPAGAPNLGVSDVYQLARDINRQSGLDSSRVRVIIDPCAYHDEGAWARRLPAALTFLFGTTHAPD